ncbi:MAG: serine hydrolase [Anaerovoracaceae bacterium]|jgi:hypothetical protein
MNNAVHEHQKPLTSVPGESRREQRRRRRLRRQWIKAAVLTAAAVVIIVLIYCRITHVPAVTGLREAAVTQHSIRCIWSTDSVKKADLCQIRWSKSPQMKAAGSMRVRADRGRAVLRSLHLSTVYYIEIRALRTTPRGRTYYSSWSRPLKAETGPMRRTQLLRTLAAADAGSSVASFHSSYRIDRTRAGRALQRQASALRDKYDLAFVMIDLKSGQGAALAPGKTLYSASCLKGPYVASLNRSAPAGRLTADVDNLMKLTITQSDGAAYEELFNSFGSSYMRRMMAYSRVSSFSGAEKYDYLPVRDLAKLWVGTYWYFYRSTNSRSKTCRAWYADSLNSFIHQALHEKYTVNTKAGWIDSSLYRAQNDAGVVFAGDKNDRHPYILAVMSTACGEYDALSELVQRIDAVHEDMVAAGA